MMAEDTSSILVYSENERLMRELLAEACRVDTGSVGLVVLGKDVEQDDRYGRWGAHHVYAVEDPGLEHFNPETYTDALAAVIKEASPDLVLIGATKEGLELSARLGERLEIGIASWCVDFDIDTDENVITAQCMIYSGVGLNTYRLQGKPALATVATGIFEGEEFSGGDLAWIEPDVDIREPRLKVLDERGKIAAGTRLEDAPVIVDVGMGFEEKEDLEMAEELAQFFGGQVACTRPVSSERDWFPEWIGLSGAKLSPALCLTIGVSGAIQHMIGIRDSEVIVAVNHDEHAGIHLQADYGVVEDLYEFLPALIEVLKERSVKLA